MVQQNIGQQFVLQVFLLETSTEIFTSVVHSPKKRALKLHVPV